MRNIKLIIEYDGYLYSGWQRQPSKKTVQGTLEKCISEFTKEEIEVIGCSRTDAGVHATGYVASFKTKSTVPGDKFSIALNRYLPDDIVILSSKEVFEEFHPRFLAKGKTYCYTIINREVRPTKDRFYMAHVKKNLDIDMMKKAGEFFIGRKDFSSFKNSSGDEVNPIKNIFDIRVSRNDDIVKIYVTGDGFLYNMVRIIAGTLIEVGNGRFKPEDIIDIIESKNREKAGKTAPAYGLSLEKVYY